MKRRKGGRDGDARRLVRFRAARQGAGTRRRQGRRDGLVNTAIRHAADGFSPARARRVATEVWRAARGMDAAAVERAAECAARHLRAAGIEALIERLPADGRRAPGGWVLPLTWHVSEAVLEGTGAGRRRCYADLRRIPQNIAVHSPPTPDGDWVAGEVLDVRDLAGAADGEALARLVRARGRGRFLLLPAAAATIEANVAAARAGCLGMAAVHPGVPPGAARYLNYAVPFDASRPAVPVFSLTPAAAAALERDLARVPGFRLRARVRAVRRAGELPVLTGCIGTGSPAVYIAAHIDEPGALDNASGVGVAIEALRLLQELAGASGVPRQVRKVRFFFTVEVRGMQAWFNRPGVRADFAGGINLDMVGEAAGPDSPLRVRTGFRHQPHFAGRLLLAAARAADRVVGRLTWETGECAVSDGVPGLVAGGGHVSLEQKPGPTYHTSADRPALLDERTLRWCGVTTAAWLFRLTRLDNRGLRALARTVVGRGPRSAGRGSDAVRGARLRAEGAALLRAALPPDFYPDLETPRDYYAAGVSRRTGLWPAAADLEALRRLLPAETEDVGDEAEAGLPPGEIVPEVMFRGFLSFESLHAPRARRELRERLGLTPGWGTAKWAWMLASCCRGRRPLGRILDDLRRIGVEIDPRQARELLRCLSGLRLARPRQVLDRAALRDAFAGAGVRRGDILLVHSSLSRFGYIVGGPGTLVAALRDVLGSSGTLVMPTHSNSVLGAPPYDPARSRANTGAVPEHFRQMPGVVRSAHPTHSLAAAGPAAADICGAHREDQAPLARDGAWGRLHDLDAMVLLLCPIRSATVFHVGETWLGLPQRHLVAHVALPDGRRRVLVLPNAPWHVDHFERVMARPLLRSGALRRFALGEDHAFIGRLRPMAEASLRAIRARPEVVLGRGGTCTCHFCRVLRAGLAHWRPPA